MRSPTSIRPLSTVHCPLFSVYGGRWTARPPGPPSAIAGAGGFRDRRAGVDGMPPHHGRAGLSLVEVSVALAILSVLVAGMLGVLWQGAAASERSRKVTTAYDVARGATEAYTDWEMLDLLDGTLDAYVTDGTYQNPPRTDLPALAAVTLDGVTYTPRLTVAPAPNVSPSAVAKQLTVTVSWGSGSIVVTSLKTTY